MYIAKLRRFQLLPIEAWLMTPLTGTKMYILSENKEQTDLKKLTEAVSLITTIQPVNKEQSI